MRAQATTLVSILVGLLATHTFAQASSSPTHVVLSAAKSSGAAMNSTAYQLVGNFGDGVSGTRASNSTHVLDAGFAAMLDTSPVGRAWLTDFEPRYVTLRGSQVLTIHGSNLGAVTAVTIGGKAATTLTQQQDRMTVRVPALDEPGFPIVTAVSSGGMAQSRGPLGVLPLLTADPAPAAGVAFDVVFRGSPNDLVFWAAGALPSPPIALPGFLYGLAMNPGFLIVLSTFRLPASGELRFPIPPTNYTGTIYTQALFGTSNAGYAPGAFSNVLVLR